jgi:hypothetical protein
VDVVEWEALFTWDRYITRFFTFFTSADIGNAIEEDRGVLGIRYLLPPTLRRTPLWALTALPVSL